MKAIIKELKELTAEIRELEYSLENEVFTHASAHSEISDEIDRANERRSILIEQCKVEV